MFIADSEERRLGSMLRVLASRGLLLVSDLDGFAEAGGSIGLVTEGRPGRFDINQASLQRDGCAPAPSSCAWRGAYLGPAHPEHLQGGLRPGQPCVFLERRVVSCPNGCC